MKTEAPILKDILLFFAGILEKKKQGRYYYAAYKESWLNELGLNKNSKEEAMSSRTTKRLQNMLLSKYPKKIKVEAPVAEGMTLRFERFDENGKQQNEIKIDSAKLQAFDVLYIENGTAYEISLSDAFAEFFKDVLKALLDSRVKKLYLCMRNHRYKGSKKSGFIKVNDSEMVQQYISLARLYKLEIILVDIFPECNKKNEQS
jgi:hypothetical protein